MVTTTGVSRGVQIILVAELITSWAVLTKRFMHLIFTSSRSEGIVSFLFELSKRRLKGVLFAISSLLRLYPCFIIPRSSLISHTFNQNDDHHRHNHHHCRRHHRLEVT